MENRLPETGPRGGTFFKARKDCTDKGYVIQKGPRYFLSDEGQRFTEQNSYRLLPTQTPDPVATTAARDELLPPGGLSITPGVGSSGGREKEIRRGKTGKARSHG